MIWFVIIALGVWVAYSEHRINLANKSLLGMAKLADEKVAELQAQIEILKRQADDDRKRNHAEAVAGANAIEKMEGFKGWGN